MSLNLSMITQGQRQLATGQVWRTGVAHIEILGLGKRLIHYRITKHLGHKRVSAQLSGIEAMAHYLQLNRARLVANPSNN